MKIEKMRALGSAGAMAIALLAGAGAFAAQLPADDSIVHSDRAELAKAKRADARTSVAAFLQSRGRSKPTADSLVETMRFTDKNGVTHVRFEQRLNGLRVYGGYARAAVDASGALTQLIERSANAGGFKARPTITDADALAAAVSANFKGEAVPAFAARNGAVSEFAKTGFFYRGPTVERVVISDGVLSEGFLVETWSQKDNKLYHTLVDGIGRVVLNELRTADDSYNIFPDHPGNSSQTVTAGPGAGNAQSPSGWLAGSQTTVLVQGNNVRAYLDRTNDSVPDGSGPSVTNGNFLAVANLGQAPTTQVNQEVAVQNLFYLNNVTHDRLYTHGFIEGAGNFQENNFGNGGLGSDSVNAEAQDGGSTNNANFSTPTDGENPRMQMYLWTQTAPNRDGDLDSDIVYHEYGHGLTWRMIGGMGTTVSGAIGEGMSDVLAILFNNDDAVGEYSFNNSRGIRSSRYANHPDTLGDFSRRAGVHRNGEIYAATIWDVWELYQANSIPVTTLLDDLVGGMNFTPSTPTYISMRDGILAQTPAARDCLIWQGFAQRGMGQGAAMTSTGGVTESFSVPSTCSGGGGGDVPSLANLTGAGAIQNGGKWRATATATVNNGTGSPLSGIVVSFSASTGANGSCTTGTSGACSYTLSNLSRASVTSVTLTATALNGNASATGVPRSVVVNQP